MARAHPVKVVESGMPIWALSCNLLNCSHRRTASRMLEQLGFRVIGREGYTYLVHPPKGWTIEYGFSQAQILDEEGNLRLVDHYETRSLNCIEIIEH